ncbi:aspartyl protease [Nostoc sp. FACHB-87]|uniref:aspartyl protease n=2 Tax=Cyanophyceae TaxID=3028117 RepID=UPI0028C5063A|nr:aspartyl protease [Nostoc sp. FACHB-87]
MRQNMISGHFGDEDELFFEIDLIAADGLEIPVDALFDTGFSWWLAINNQDLEALNWVYLEQQTMLTAQGEAEFEIYLGKVRIDQEYLDIPVHVGQGLTEILLGRQWLKNRKLVVDMPSQVLTLGQQ